MANSRTAIEVAIVDGATKVLNEIKNGTKAVQSSFTELNNALELVEKGFALIGAAAGFAKDLLQPARDAETAIQRIATASGATAETMATLTKTAQDVAFNTRVAFSEVAAGAEVLVRDGATATEVIQNLATVTQFGAAATLKTAEAAGLLGGILDSYGAKTAEVGAIGDVITAAAISAGVGVKELAEGINKIGPVANNAGLSIGETAALLGVLAENGQGGGKAVKNLEVILTEFTDPASKAGEVLTKLGLDTSDLGGIFQRLSTDTTAAQLVMEQLGPKAALSLKLLLAEGGGALKDLTAIINESGGASKAAADDIGSTFDGAVNRILIALDTAKAAFFTPLLDPLAAEIDKVSAKIKSFSETQDFKILSDVVGQFASDAITQLNRIASEFDAEVALAALRKFVLDMKIQLAGLSEAAATVKTVFDGFGVALNGAQTIGANIKGTFAELGIVLAGVGEKIVGTTETGTKFINFLDGVADGARKAADANSLEFAAALESLNGEIGPATLELRKLQEAQFAQADAARAGAQANQEAVNVLPQVTDLSQELKDILTQTAGVTVTVGDGLVEMVKKPSGPVDALRARLADLNEQLRKSFADGTATDAFGKTTEATQALVDEIAAADAELQKLTKTAEPAAKAVKEVGDKSEESAGKVSDLGDSSSEAADKAEKLTESSEKAGEQFGVLARDATIVSEEIKGVSQAFLDLFNAQRKTGEGFSEYAKTRLNVVLDAQRKEYEAALKLTDAVDVELEKRLVQLRQKFNFLSDDVLTDLAKKQLAAEKARNAPAPMQGASGGQGDTRSGLGAPVFNINFSALSVNDVSDTTIKDLVRRIASPLTAHYRSMS